MGYEGAKFFLESKQEPAGQNLTKMGKTLPCCAKPSHILQLAVASRLGNKTMIDIVHFPEALLVTSTSKRAARTDLTVEPRLDQDSL